MLKLFCKRLKDQRGFAVETVLIITGLITLTVGLWSMRATAEKTQYEKIDVTKYAEAQKAEDPSEAYEKNSKAFVKLAVEGGKTAAGIYDDTGILFVADQKGIFTSRDDKANEEKKPKENLNKGIEKIIERKVKLNSNSNTTPQEAKTIVNKLMQNVQKAEKKIDIDSNIQDALQADGKLADTKIIDLKKALKKNQLSYDYNNKILEKYIEDLGKDEGIPDNTDSAEAKRRLEIINIEIKKIEAKIKELESAEQIPPETTATNETGEDTGWIDETQSNDTIPDAALLPELNLKGTLSYTYDGTSWTTTSQITLNINFETQIVSGTYSWSGPGGLFVGNKFVVEYQSTANGTINGTIDRNSKIISAIVSYSGTSEDATYEGVTYPGGDDSGEFWIKGSLDENNIASGTTEGGAVLSASPQ